MIYLDNSMTTRPSRESISAMMPFLTERWGTPSAPHSFGQQIYPALEDSYRSIYALLEASDNDNFVFTSSGAEAVNHVLNSSYFDITKSTGKNQIVSSKIDEAPVIMSLNRLEQLGCVGKLVDKITPDAIAEAITPRTALISLEWANGMTGVIHPVSEIAKLCQMRGIRFHLDATHILGRLYFDPKEVGADLITFNGDHLHAPKGTGGLYIKENVEVSPFIQGAQRIGNVPGLIALGTAAKQMMEARDYVCTEVARLRDKLEKGIVSYFPSAIPLFQDLERLPHITAIAFPGISNEAMLFLLNRKGVFGSIGGGTFQQISLILQASGIEKTLSHSAINFTLSRETTEDEIDRAIEIISETAKRLSRLWEKK